MVASDDTREAEAEPLFEFYECMVGDQAALVRVNLTQQELGVDEARRHNLCISTAFLNPTEQGFIPNEEFEVLSTFEDAPLTALAPSLFVGVLTNAGQRTWYFYTDDPERDAHQARRVAERTLAAYEFEAGSVEDPEWRQYYGFLYPNELAWQWIKDRRVIETLREHGDQSEVPRPIDHYAFFPSRRMRRAYLKALAKRGYREGDGLSNDRDPPNKFGLHFLRAEPEAPADIYPLTEQLVLLALEHDDIYDGWGCTVVDAPGARND